MKLSREIFCTESYKNNYLIKLSYYKFNDKWFNQNLYLYDINHILSIKFNIISRGSFKCHIIFFSVFLPGLNILI